MRYFENLRLDKLLQEARAVIFDMNGLIVDDEPTQLEAYNHVLNKKISEKYWIDRCVGRKATEFLKELGIENIEKTIKEKNQKYMKLMKERTKEIVRPGILEIINFLFGNKSLAIATSASKTEVDIILGVLNIKDKFQIILTGEDTLRGKPDPEIYLKIAEMMELNPSDCLVIEDSSTGVNSAFNAGMKILAMASRYTKNQDFKNATFIINNLEKKAKIILE